MSSEVKNIKKTIYLNRSLDEAIVEFATNKGWSFQKTMRYLINVGLESYNNGGEYK